MKPKWLKTSYIKRKITDKLLDCFFLPKKEISEEHQRCKHKLLVTSTDGLGDTFLRFPLLKAWQKQYVHVWVLTQAVSAPIYKAAGFHVIIYTHKMRTNLRQRIKLIHYLNRQAFNRIYAAEFIRNDNLVKYLQGYTLGCTHPRLETRNQEVDVLIDTAPYQGTVLKKYALMTQCLQCDTTDNRPFFPAPSPITTKNIILLAIGAQDIGRMMRVSNLCLLIQKLLINDPRCTILLVGNGKKEQHYARKILKTLPLEAISHVISTVDKYSLLELIPLIYQSKILLGFDSGLYNLSYTLHHPTICLASENERMLHRHASWVRIIKNTHGNIYGIKDQYGNTITNALPIADVIEAYNSLTHHNVKAQKEKIIPYYSYQFNFIHLLQKAHLFYEFN